MISAVGPDWLDRHVLPEIQDMLVQDAYFKLMGYARELTGKFNGAIAGLTYVGYVTSQAVAIRRLCDNRRDVISLRRVLEVAGKTNPAVAARAGYLSQKLDACRSISDLVDNYIAHSGNPQRRPNMAPWQLRQQQLTDAQKAVCEVAMILARDLLQRDYVGGDAGRSKRRHHGGFQVVGARRGHPEALEFLAPSPGDREQLALVRSTEVNVPAMAGKKTTREVERHYFEQFRKAYPLQAGTVAYGDKPDVTLTGERTIGIEVSRLYLEAGRVAFSEQQQRPLRHAVVTEAQALYRANGGKAIELTIAFDDRKPITPLRRKSLPGELAALAKRIDSSPASSEVKSRYFHAMPEISSVYLNTREYADAEWRIIGSYGVRLMSQADLESIVRDKETASAKYDRRDAYWLLVVVDPMDPAQEQEIRNRRHQRCVASVRENHRVQARL